MKDLQQSSPLEPGSSGKTVSELSPVPVTSLITPPQQVASVLNVGAPPQKVASVLNVGAPPLVPWQPPEIPTAPLILKRQPSYAEKLTQNLPNKDSPSPVASPVSLQPKKLVNVASYQQRSQAPLALTQTLPQQYLALQPRQTLPVTSPYKKSTAPQTAAMMSTRPPLFEQPLEVGNYHLKFRKLLISEEDAHSKLLKERFV